MGLNRVSWIYKRVPSITILTCLLPAGGHIDFQKPSKSLKNRSYFIAIFNFLLIINFVLYIFKND